MYKMYADNINIQNNKITINEYKFKTKNYN